MKRMYGHPKVVLLKCMYGHPKVVLLKWGMDLKSEDNSVEFKFESIGEHWRIRIWWLNILIFYFSIWTSYTRLEDSDHISLKVWLYVYIYIYISKNQR